MTDDTILPFSFPAVRGKKVSFRCGPPCGAVFFALRTVRMEGHTHSAFGRLEVDETGSGSSPLQDIDAPEDVGKSRERIEVVGL